ncbi:MAG: tetratricopeptide repeat protein, partial [Alphaproteobacteria bacterium]|nr:tetratricopeptide repeat protein [Alphaproteobacteria bacterium]
MSSDPGGAAAALQEGLAAAQRGDAEGALRAWRRARTLDPADQGTILRLGDLLIRIGRFAEADDALAEGTPNPAIARRRAICALAFGHFTAAEAFARAALDDAAEGAQARQFLASVLIQRGDVQGAREQLALAKAADPAFETAYTDDLFAANYDPAMTGAALKDLYADWAQRFCPPEAPLAAPAPGGRRLKVAYVSPDLRRHSLRHFISPIFRHHDRAMIEVHAYSLSGTPEAEAAALRKRVDVWHDCQALDDD